MINTSQITSYNKNINFNGKNVKFQGNSGLMFRTRPDKDTFISFGWSKNVPQSSTEEEILKVLSDPANKTAIVVSHTNADGDAYGSNIGTAGMLNNLGIKTYSVIDDQPRKLFSRMPSVVEGQPATSFIKTSADIKKELEAQKIDQFDIAVITDSSTPDRTIVSTKNGEKVLDLATKAKKVIVIDHHSDGKDQPSNEEQWKQALTDKGIQPENILYWREERASASEMIAELDKEFNDESEAGKLSNYKTGYKGYRLALASGIFSDTGAVGKKADQVKMARLSRKSYKMDTESIGNVTRQMFDWLLNTCGITKTDINLTDTTSANLPDIIRTQLEQVVEGTRHLDNITVKAPSYEDPFGYIYFENMDSLKSLAEEANKLNAERGINDKLNKLSASDLYKEMFEIAKRMDRNKDLGVLVVANKLKPDKAGNTSTSLTILSHGYEALKGEIPQDGHVFVDKAAQTILTELTRAKLGTGGGHDNAKGFKSSENLDFYNDLLPVIRNALEKCTITRNAPKEFTLPIALNVAA